MSFVDARRGYVVISNNTDTHSHTHTSAHLGVHGRVCTHTARTHTRTAICWLLLLLFVLLPLVAVGNVSWSSNKFGKQTRFGLCFIVVVGCGCCCRCRCCCLCYCFVVVLGIPNVCQRQATALLLLLLLLFLWFSFFVCLLLLIQILMRTLIP